jgi:hypothetical protein
VLPVFSKKLAPRSTSRSPSPSRSASSGAWNRPTLARPKGSRTGAAKAGAASEPVFWKNSVAPSKGRMQVSTGG